VFLDVGYGKLVSQRLYVREFAIIGIGQWFRYFVGILEVAAPGSWARQAARRCALRMGSCAAQAVVQGISVKLLIECLLPGVQAPFELYSLRI
jgi:hypothetical protein